AHRRPGRPPRRRRPRPWRGPGAPVLGSTGDPRPPPPRRSEHRRDRRHPPNPRRHREVAAVRCATGARRTTRTSRQVTGTTAPRGDWDDARLAAAFRVRFDAATPTTLSTQIRAMLERTRPEPRARFPRPSMSLRLAAVPLVV